MLLCFVLYLFFSLTLSVWFVEHFSHCTSLHFDAHSTWNVVCKAVVATNRKLEACKQNVRCMFRNCICFGRYTNEAHFKSEKFIFTDCVHFFALHPDEICPEKIRMENWFTIFCCGPIKTSEKTVIVVEITWKFYVRSSNSSQHL